MKKLFLTFIVGVIKDRLNETVSSATVGFISEHKKKLIASFVYFQFSLILISISAYQLVNDITLAIVNDTFPTPEIYVSIGVCAIIIISNIFLIKSLKKTYRDYLFNTNSILPKINDNIFSPITRQLKIERNKYEATNQL